MFRKCRAGNQGFSRVWLAPEDQSSWEGMKGGAADSKQPHEKWMAPERATRRKEEKKEETKEATDGGCCSRRGRIRAKDGLALALVLVLVLRCGFLLFLNKNSPAVPVSGRGSGMDSSNRAFTRKETPVGGVRLGLISQCRWTLLS